MFYMYFWKFKFVTITALCLYMIKVSLKPSGVRIKETKINKKLLLLKKFT